MPCYYPLKMSRAAEVNKNTGKRPLVANPINALVDGSTVIVPCGRCRGCRARRAQEWAIRLQHEASLHGEENSFLTLTYSDDHVPRDYSVKKRDIQLFMKKLRKRSDNKIRFFGVGEYGEAGLRPHYHLCLLNFLPPDLKYLCKRGDNRVFTSEMISEIWPYGSHEIGNVSAGSASYVARYTFKKISGPKADDYYNRISPMTGELHHVEPEFALMSRRPGIASGWYDKFHADAFPSDFVILDGRKVLPPVYYLRKLQQRDELAASSAPSPAPALDASASPEAAPFRFSAKKGFAENLQRKRKAAAAQPAAKANRTAARLAVREEIHLAREARLVRSL